MSYDAKCYELAKHFLEDAPEGNTEEGCKNLAQHIQNVIEQYLEADSFDRQNWHKVFDLNPKKGGRLS
jgi:hypothetical protein